MRESLPANQTALNGHPSYHEGRIFPRVATAHNIHRRLTRFPRKKVVLSVLTSTVTFFSIHIGYFFGSGWCPFTIIPLPFFYIVHGIFIVLTFVDTTDGLVWMLTMMVVNMLFFFSWAFAEIFPFLSEREQDTEQVYWTMSTLSLTASLIVIYYNLGYTIFKMLTKRVAPINPAV